jgi:SAM-dependent methyltransferase
MGRKSIRVLAVLMLLLMASGGQVLGDQDEGAKTKPALDVPYEPTSYGIARAMLDMAHVTSKDFVYDLGCGDGRIVIMAAKERGARGIGVDLDPARIRESKANAEAAGVTHLVSFFEQNLFDTDISKATVMMLYLWPEVNLRARPKLLKELKPGTRIVSHSHTMGDWEDDATQKVEGHDLHFFVVPANVTGTWEWKTKSGQRASLYLTQRFQKVNGFVTIGRDAMPITGVSLKGDFLRFSVEEPGQKKRRVLSFQGRVRGDTITGKVTRGEPRQVSSWRAVRDPSSVLSIVE